MDELRLPPNNEAMCKEHLRPKIGTGKEKLNYSVDKTVS
jgi:hypothetical protein